MTGFKLSRATLSRYIATRIIAALGVAFAVVTGIIMLVDFVEGSRNLSGNAEISSFELVLLTLLKTPTLIEQTIPFVVLFGVMGALYNLNRRSELIVMRASGISAWRFLKPVILVTGLFGAMWTVFLNPLSSRMMAQYDAMESRFANVDTSDRKEIWLREGSETSQTVIRAASYDSQTATLREPTFYQLRSDGQGGRIFSKRFDAERAKLMPQGYWQLYTVIENIPGQPKQDHQTVALPTSTTLEQLRSSNETETIPPFWRLPESIRANEDAGFSSLDFRMQFHKLLSLPVLLIAMTFIAASVSMQMTRSGGTLKLLITGAALGFGVYFTNSMINSFGEAAMIPVTLAVWTTPLLVLFLGVSYLAKIEDG